MGPVPDIVAKWSVAKKNITIQMTCNPNLVKAGPLAWCAFGINTANTLAMGPAMVWWIAVSAAGVPLGVEDRVIVKVAEPACVSTQMTHLLGSHYDAKTGVLSANFTRRLNTTAQEKELGYPAITDEEVSLVGAAGGNPAPRPPALCSMQNAEHYGSYNGFKVNFLA